MVHFQTPSLRGRVHSGVCSLVLQVLHRISGAGEEFGADVGASTTFGVFSSLAVHPNSLKTIIPTLRQWP